MLPHEGATALSGYEGYHFFSSSHKPLIASVMAFSKGYDGLIYAKTYPLQIDHTENTEEAANYAFMFAFQQMPLAMGWYGHTVNIMTGK
jgi:hypothetical protein